MAGAAAGCWKGKSVFKARKPVQNPIKCTWYIPICTINSEDNRDIIMENENRDNKKESMGKNIKLTNREG